MKKIGVISDTHSCWDYRFLKYFKECDEIWHAGDIGNISIAKKLENICQLRAVSGNIDSGETKIKYPEIQIFNVENLNVLITHIGGYPGKYSPGIKEMIKKNKIDIFISGHSHILKIMYDKELNLLHINPGAAGKYGWQSKRTIVRFEINSGDNKNNQIQNLEVIEFS